MIEEYSKFSNNKNIEKVVISLCSTIEKQTVNYKKVWTEYDLRKELVACILGSQVRFEMANEALTRIENYGLLENNLWFNKDVNIENDIYKILTGNENFIQKNWCYRFPKSRSLQIGSLKNILQTQSLTRRLNSHSNTLSLRKHLVLEMPGIGPKQASMFIRNIGFSYDIAILDIHVINFMIITRLLTKREVKICQLNKYEETENIMVKYANKIGYAVGHLDRAIWVTMRALKEMN